MRRPLMAKELLTKDKNTIISFMKSNEEDDMNELLKSMSLLKEEPEEKVQRLIKTDPLREEIDADTLMQSLINLSIKTKIDARRMQRIDEEPEEYSEPPAMDYQEDHFEKEVDDIGFNPTFNIDAFVEDENQVF